MRPIKCGDMCRRLHNGFQSGNILVPVTAWGESSVRLLMERALLISLLKQAGNALPVDHQCGNQADHESVLIEQIYTAQ